MVAQGWDMRGVIFISWVKKDAESAPLWVGMGEPVPQHRSLRTEMTQAAAFLTLHYSGEMMDAS